jgi:hypothetical protein
MALACRTRFGYELYARGRQGSLRLERRVWSSRAHRSLFQKPYQSIPVFNMTIG